MALFRFCLFCSGNWVFLIFALVLCPHLAFKLFLSSLHEKKQNHRIAFRLFWVASSSSPFHWFYNPTFLMLLL